MRNWVTTLHPSTSLSLTDSPLGPLIPREPCSPVSPTCPYKGFHRLTQISAAATVPHHVSMNLIYLHPTRSIWTRCALKHTAQYWTMRLRSLSRCFQQRQRLDCLRHHHALLCRHCFQEGLVHPARRQIFRLVWNFLRGMTHIVQIRLLRSFHLRSLRAIFSRSSWFSVSSRISLK